MWERRRTGMRRVGEGCVRTRILRARGAHDGAAGRSPCARRRVFHHVDHLGGAGVKPVRAGARSGCWPSAPARRGALPARGARSLRHAGPRHLRGCTPRARGAIRGRRIAMNDNAVHSPRAGRDLGLLHFLRASQVHPVRGGAIPMSGGGSCRWTCTLCAGARFMRLFPLRLATSARAGGVQLGSECSYVCAPAERAGGRPIPATCCPS